MKKQREVYIDFLRIIACFWIIYNHTNERGFWKFAFFETGSLPWIGYNVLAVGCKFALPVFFMISGATVLKGKETSFFDNLKRVPKFLVDIVVFVFLGYFVDAVYTGKEFSFLDMPGLIYNTGYWHLWYLYAYIAFIITLPFLKRFVKVMDTPLMLYMCIIYVIFKCVVPFVEIYTGNLNDFFEPTWLTTNIFFYPILGYFLGVQLDIKRIKRKHILGLWVVNFMCYAVSMYCQYNFSRVNVGNMKEHNLIMFQDISAAVIFLTVRYIFAHRTVGEFTAKAITEVGKCTFGVYLMHVSILWLIPIFCRVWDVFESLGWYGVFLSCIGTFVVATGLTYIFRKIPIIKYLF